MIAMAPLFQVIFGLEGFEATAFWLTGFIIVVGSGFFIEMLMEKQGFGPFFNSMFAMTGAFGGLYLRYNYFLKYPYTRFEPYLTFALMAGSIAILLVTLSFLRNRMP